MPMNIGHGRYRNSKVIVYHRIDEKQPIRVEHSNGKVIKVLYHEITTA